MIRACEKCGRGWMMSASRSHSNIKTKKRQFVNLLTKRVGGVRMRICANCLKALAKSS